jgi:DNA replication protein DnaC
MLRQQTINKLRKMNMGPVVDAAASIDGSAGGLSKEEWLDILVDRLYEERMTTKVNNLIRAARLPCPGAHIEDLITDADRELDIGLIDRLATCAYIAKGHNVIVLGASGAGKSWLVSALALSECRQLYRVECVSMPEMVDELGTLRYDPIAHAKRTKQLKNRQLLVIDDWLLKETKPEAVDELFAVVDARTRARKSTVVCAQYRVEGWPSRMGDYPAAESIVDRLKNNAYVIELKGEVSMRERCMDEELRAYAERQKKG